MQLCAQTQQKYQQQPELGGLAELQEVLRSPDPPGPARLDARVACEGLVAERDRDEVVPRRRAPQREQHDRSGGRDALHQERQQICREK